MIESVEFRNFRALRSATLPLTRCTLLLGPNGAGKSTAVKGLLLLAEWSRRQLGKTAMVLGQPQKSLLSETDMSFGSTAVDRVLNNGISARWTRNGIKEHPAETVFLGLHWTENGVEELGDTRLSQQAMYWLEGIRAFTLDPVQIAKPMPLRPSAEIESSGANLSVVLTQMQDRAPERFESLNRELSQWLPEFDRVLFDTGLNGERGLMLRTRMGGYAVKAEDLSHGTLLVLCILSLSFLQKPPTLVCLEEPDHGIHPRLLRQVHDAMVRLSEPEQFGDPRAPVQVLATTHSPNLLDLFRDHPEDVVLAEKTAHGATFHKLTDMPHYQEIMGDAPLGDAWYSGILGGVPAAP
jgi:predicted ATPase